MTHSSIQSDRRSNERASGQITSLTSLHKQVEGYMRSENLQLPYKYDGHLGQDGQDGHHGRHGHHGSHGHHGRPGHHGHHGHQCRHDRDGHGDQVTCEKQLSEFFPKRNHSFVL